MLGIPFSRLRLRGQWRAEPKDRIVSAVGLDTETQDGLAKLICSRSFSCRPRCFDDCVTFLTRTAFRSKILSFYNLRYDIQALLKWLPETYWQELHEKGACDYYGTALRWIPGKFFKITRKIGGKNRPFTFFDCSQFYNRMSLDAAARKYLGKQKTDPGIDIANLHDADFDRADIIRYCKNDAALCEDLMNLFIVTCHRAGLYPTNFASPASISTRYFLQHVKIPTINTLIKRFPATIRVAWKATTGAFICCFKRGYFPKVFEYDINSAYPFAMSNLPNLDGGALVMQKGDPPSTAFMGWMECRITHELDDPGWYHPPICIKKRDGLNYFPIGEYRTFLTLNEYREYEKDFLIEPVGGLYWIPDTEPQYLYRDVINKLYALKTEAKNDESLYDFYKKALNGFYGKCLEKHLERDPANEHYGLFHTGHFFNPFYASYILADTRIMVYRALKRFDRDALIACFTDSILTTEPLTGIDFGPDLGQWQPVKEGDLLMIGCGVYTMRSNGKIKSKLRGFKTTTRTNLFDEVAKFHKSESIRLSVRVNYSLALSLSQHNPADMNKLLDTERTTEINFDRKRLWGGKFKRCGDLLTKQLDSVPLLYGMV